MALFRLGGRGSQLALIQARQIQEELRSCFPELEISLDTFTTSGDRQAEIPFSKMGIKGVFVKELDDALMAGKIDAAVHSLKDLPSECAPGIRLSAVTTCVEPRDALISRGGLKLRDLPAGGTLGTSSIRRTAFLALVRPDLRIEPLRGNLDTRLRRLEEGKLDGIILAAAGLKRIGRVECITEYLDPMEFPPPIGQGMLAITCRADDSDATDITAAVGDPCAFELATIQRQFMALMGGGCQVPLGCYAEEKGAILRLSAVLALPDGSRVVREAVGGKREDGAKLAEKLAAAMLDGGGREILGILRSVP